MQLLSQNCTIWRWGQGKNVPTEDSARLFSKLCDVFYQHQQQEMIFKESGPGKSWGPATDKRSVFFLWVKFKLTVEHSVKHGMLRRKSLLYTWTENSVRSQAIASQPLIGDFPWRYIQLLLSWLCHPKPSHVAVLKVFCVNVKRTRYSTGFCQNKLLVNTLQCL